MLRDRVEADAQRVKLVVDGVARDEQVRAGLRELIVVYVGSDIFSTDETFVVASFADQLWVLPELTHGMNRWLFEYWRAFLDGFPQIYEAQLEELPKAWRERRLGIPMPRPRLGSYGLQTLPGWVSKTPLAFGVFPQLGSAEV